MRSKKDNEWKIQVGQEAYELFQDKTKDLLPESEEYKKCLENLTGCMIWINRNDFLTRIKEKIF